MKAKATEWDALPFLHVCGSFSYHDTAYIAGSREGLTALNEAIELALKGRASKAKVIASDGEGYSVSVAMHRTVAGLGSPPYIDDFAKEIVRYEKKIAADWRRARRGRA